VRKGVLCPWIAGLNPQRSFSTALGGSVIAAQLVGECHHGQKIRIVCVHGFKTCHVRAKPCTHMLLTEHVINELGEFCSAEITGPFGSDGLHRLDSPQIVIGMPQDERPMECGLSSSTVTSRPRASFIPTPLTDETSASSAVVQR
jgi:hypothetical protein